MEKILRRLRLIDNDSSVKLIWRGIFLWATLCVVWLIS